MGRLEGKTVGERNKEGGGEGGHDTLTEERSGCGGNRTKHVVYEDEVWRTQFHS